jgi:dCTP deaminase
VLVHFTAPTIHAGFEGTIALELVNLGVQPFLLYPDLYICQLLFEPVEGEIVPTVNQFRGQRSPTGGPER